MARQVARIQGTENWRQSPHAALFAAALERTRRQIEEAEGLEGVMDAVLWDRIAQEKSLDFLGFVANFLVRRADPRHEHPQRRVDLPLPADVPMAWRVLPQFLFEIITDQLLYVMRYERLIVWLTGRVPDVIGDRPRPELVILALTFIGPSGSDYVQNPHLKAKLAEMLYWGTLKHPRYPYGLFGEILNSNSFALEWTFPAAMSFYIGKKPPC